MDNFKNYVYGYCKIKNGNVVVNGETLPVQNNSFAELAKNIYQYLKLDYPKFFKMDELCKLSFLAAEILLKDFTISNYKENETAIILSNHSSTIETDKKHQKSIADEQNYFPSPAVFVYTLPNIAIGEIAIRHKLKGENTFFVSEKYDIDFMVNYCNSILNLNKAQLTISGWVEYSNNQYEGFLYLAGKEFMPDKSEHNTLFINSLYI